MRKHCKRIQRTLAVPISPQQHVEIMLTPRIHLEMLLNNNHDINYKQSVLGVFTLSVALAQSGNTKNFLSQQEIAQNIMADLIDEKRGLNINEADYIRRCFNQAETFIRFQSTAKLSDAINFIEQKVSSSARPFLTLPRASILENKDSKVIIRVVISQQINAEI